MVDTSASGSALAPNARHAPKPTPVSDGNWVQVVQTFTKSLGSPELRKAGAPTYVVADADEALWGDEVTGVHLVRGAFIAPARSSIYLQADSMAQFKALVSDFKRLKLKVKDPVTTLLVYREGHFGSLRTENVTFTSYYLNFDKENVANSDVVGVAEVGHNPPPKQW